MKLKNGRTISEIEEYNRGSAENPMSEADLQTKFHENAEGFLDAGQLLHDDVEDELLGTEDLPQLRDEREDLLELGDDLLALEPGQAVQTHVEDRLCLDVVELQDLRALAPAAVVRELGAARPAWR